MQPTTTTQRPTRRKTQKKSYRKIIGVALLIIAVALILYDFYSPPVGELSNFTLIVFAKLTGIAGALLNINLKDL